MKDKLKVDKPTAVMVEEKYKIYMTADEEMKFMQAFIDACSLASGVASQVKHDCFRDLMVKHFIINIRKEMAAMIDPMVEEWKNTPGKDMSWIDKLDKVKFSAKMNVCKDAAIDAFQPEKLGSYKSSTIDITLNEEEFEFHKKSFKEAEIKLEYKPDVVETAFADIPKEVSYVEFSYELKS